MSEPSSVSGVFAGAGSTVMCSASGRPQPAVLHASMRTTQSPAPSTAISASDSSTWTPSLSLFPAPLARQRTQYISVPATSSQSSSTFAGPASESTSNPVGLAGRSVVCADAGGAGATELAKSTTTKASETTLRDRAVVIPLPFPVPVLAGCADGAGTESTPTNILKA